MAQASECTVKYAVSQLDLVRSGSLRDNQQSFVSPCFKPCTWHHDRGPFLTLWLLWSAGVPARHLHAGSVRTVSRFDSVLSQVFFLGSVRLAHCGLWCLSVCVCVAGLYCPPACGNGFCNNSVEHQCRTQVRPRSVMWPVLPSVCRSVPGRHRQWRVLVCARLRVLGQPQYAFLPVLRLLESLLSLINQCFCCPHSQLPRR